MLSSIRDPPFHCTSLLPLLQPPPLPPYLLTEPIRLMPSQPPSKRPIQSTRNESFHSSTKYHASIFPQAHSLIMSFNLQASYSRRKPSFLIPFSRPKAMCANESYRRLRLGRYSNPTTTIAIKTLSALTGHPACQSAGSPFLKPPTASRTSAMSAPPCGAVPRMRIASKSSHSFLKK